MKTIGNLAYTHGGKFHADDVFSAALLRILNPEIHFARVMNLPKDFNGLAFDIGCGEFDHHHASSPIRENETPYAAFGLLWREFGPQLASEAECLKFDESFVQPIDLDDNTGCGYPLSGMISSFNPAWDSDESPDDWFEQAVDIATAILDRKLESLHAISRAGAIVNEAYEKMENNIVILPVYAPWKSTLASSEASFVVYPSQRGGYCAQGIPAEPHSNELKVPFPQEWAGKTQEELVACSGILTLSFCHNSRFLLSTGTLEDAVLACNLSKNHKPALSGKTKTKSL